MIDELSLTNFRAFKSQSFKFSKLNIFVGPNNSGKSSAISSINILAQTFLNGANSSNHISINGEFDQLGTFKDMVHGGRANTPVKLAFKIGRHQASYEFKYRSQRREIEITRFRLDSEGSRTFEYVAATSDKYDVYFKDKKIEEIHKGISKRRPIFAGLSISQDYMFRLRRNSTGAYIDTNSPDHALIKDVDIELIRFRRNLINNFTNFDSLGPFRVLPQRTYLYSGEVFSRIGRSGENTVAILAADNSKRGSESLGLVDEISKWMKNTGISDGISVRNLTERHFEVSISGADGLAHNICDVGFGCSQVLPVLVAGLKHGNTKSMNRQRTVIIQEPEIHLHPNAQAELGTFFAMLTKAPGQVFIETHSDNLILRVGRHCALGDINPSDVKVFFIQDNNGVKSVTEIEFDKDGGFTPAWPGGFFPQRQAESFALARASIASASQEAQVK